MEASLYEERNNICNMSFNQKAYKSNGLNYLRDFTFHKDMYKAYQKGDQEVDQKDPIMVGNLKVRRVAKEHPKVNLPVFRKNRNEKIKVFSVNAKDRKQKWKNIEK